jgi:hypothetical protein
MTRSVAFALLAVLLTVGQASPECAWVLWVTVPNVNPRDPNLLLSMPVGGWKTLEECEQLRAVRQAEPVSGTRILACLPDTVDPRWHSR